MLIRRGIPLLFVSEGSTNLVSFHNYSLAGMSRSVTVAVAYIMSATNLSWKEALKVVRAGRSVANPNLGFQKQLQEFEDTRLIEVSALSIFFLCLFFIVICFVESKESRK